MDKCKIMSDHDVALFVYGEGGHRAQMNRLMTRISNRINKKIVTLSDYPQKENWSSEHYITREFRNKYSTFMSVLNFNQLHQIIVCLKLTRKYKIKVMVSTGPGVVLIPAIILKFFRGVQIIHLETWSRFETKSFTGKIMYYIADDFYVQHESLLQQYPNAKYAGVL
ncbi:hypothetical protein I5504_07300 [Citrobacter koseri]|nr:hypothetical protein [Citrobacter koseri]MBJ9302860.1 hypothetical protein [Citrobacter koseri]MBJ9367366.1 hypothetical protein [Citrobacter koseri]SUX89541.1 Oligosaccharide biosynthesis protein Alg14 like [Citrobacter koseri]HAT2780412.1 hypothetical protein [Citrobacter koseri]